MAPIEAVISGIGGAFPQSEGMEDFVDNLFAGKNLSSVDDLRWEPGLLGTSPHVGKIRNVKLFDNNLFRTHRPLARLMDPLARLLLERSMEAILDAGLSPKALENTYTSVFMTTTVSESESRTTSILTSKKAGGYAIMAGSKTMMSNRISYFLNLNGPSITLDGDWTVTLIALQRAARSIESGESDYALIGAANTCLFPELNKVYENFGVLSADGECRSLDASASGCFRSEGAIVFLLQRSDMASRIYARVRGVEELCVGTRSRFVGVDTRLLPPLLDDLYQSRGFHQEDIELIASDGISIPEIERDEIQATAAALCKRRKGLPVTSAKAVAGHGDASSGLVSMILAIAAMERGCIPPLKHFVQPHPGAKALLDGRMKAVTTAQPITLNAESMVGINTLGFSGGIGHTILMPNDKIKQPCSDENKEYPRLIIVSGRTEEDSVNVANKIIGKPFDPEFIRLTHQAFSQPIAGYRYRAMSVIPSADPANPPIVFSKESDQGDRPVWFVYSGMGSQWAGMGKGLLRLPVFAETIQRLQPVLEPEGIDLIATLTTDDSDLFENIVYSFISIAAVQIGLTNVLRSIGIEPKGIIGHSTGELGCAYGDGCLSEEETLQAAYGRGKASLAAKLTRGMMASIGMGWKEALNAVPPSIDVACHNTGDNCTISGPTDDVLQFVEELKAKNIFARTVNVSNIAFHSRYVKPAGDILKQYLNQIIASPRKRSERWVASSVNPGDEDKLSSLYAGPDFFTNNLLSPVRFEEAMKSVPRGAVVVELAPHGLMLPLIKRELPDNAVCISLTKRNHQDGLRFLLENVGKLYLENISLKPWVLAPEVSLPVSRGTPGLASLVTWDHREEWPLIVSTKSEVTRPRSVPLYTESTPCITQDGARCVAPSELLEIVWREVAGNKPLIEFPIVFEDLEFINELEMTGNENLFVELVLQQKTGTFELATSVEDGQTSVCLLRGRINREELTQNVDMMTAQPQENSGIAFETKDVYAELNDQGLKYDEALKTLRNVTFSKTETVGQCCWSGRWSILIDSLLQLSALSNGEGSIFCGKIRKLSIAPHEMKCVSNAIQVRYHLSTSMLAAPGVNIAGYRRAESKSSSSVSVMAMTVKPLEHLTTSDTDDFLRRVAMIRIQNSGVQDSVFSILVLEEQRDAIATSLQKALREAVGNQVAVRKVLVKPGDKVPADLKDAALIVTDFSSMQAEQVLANFSQSRPMILRCGVRGGYNGYVSLASNLSAEGSLTLMIKGRYPVKESVHVVHVLADEHVPNDVHVPEGGEVLLIWRDQPREGVFGVVACVRSKPYGARARIVIIMDGDAPEFSLQESIYAERLSLGLFVNILQNGQWNELQLSKFDDVPTVPSRVEGYETNTVGLNPADLSQDSIPQVGAYDFCGEKDGARIMGLARLGSVGVAVPDDILRWTVPSAWSDEEAATVPMAYSVAYFVLKVLTDVNVRTNRVLVMDATSPVSQACIRIATQAGCEVTATVSGEEQRKEVIALNPQMSAERVIRSDKNTFKYYLRKATKSKGFDISLVPQCGSVLDVVLQSNAMWGRVFVMSKRNALMHHVGLFPFNNSAAMFAGGLDALLTASVRDKKLVQALVQSGIAAGVVRPLPSHIFEHVDDLDLAALKSPFKQLLRLRDSAKNVRPGMSFVILGGGGDSLVSMARAASVHGSNIVLAACREGTAPPRARREPALRTTTFMPSPKAHSDAKQFLSVASKAGNIKAIVVNVEDAVDRSLATLLNGALPTVNGSLRGVRLFVVTESLTLGTETVEAWRRIGLPACAVVGDHRQAAHLLPSLLAVNNLPSTVLTYQSGTDCRMVLGASPTFRAVRSEVAVHHKGGSDCNKGLVEVTTLAPRLRSRHNRLEPLPLVSVTGPGLTASAIQEVAGCLMSPIIVGNGSQLTAETLAQEVLRVQPCGPWAMYGDAASTGMLLQAANLVEKQAGRPDSMEVVYLALLESEGVEVDDVKLHAGPLHVIRPYDGDIAKKILLNKQKTRHFASDSSQIATILNEFVLSPLSKIISC